MLRLIAESNRGDHGAGYNDITNFFGPLIFPTLLESTRYLDFLTPLACACYGANTPPMVSNCFNTVKTTSK